ncbi:MAG: ATP-binding protein [Planctomycetota bacterium]|nr:ATP-binding protein [Planctomycetota bacterium]
MQASCVGFRLRSARAECISVSTRSRARGLPRIDIVGLGASPARESLARIRSAFDAGALRWPRVPVVIEIGGEPCGGSEPWLDLPIAMGLASAGQGRAIGPPGAFAGEVGVDGSLRCRRGATQFADAWAGAAGALGVSGGAGMLCVPSDAACWLGRSRDGVVFARTLAEAVAGGASLECDSPSRPWCDVAAIPTVDPWEGVVGQDATKRALTVALAGGHSALLWGPPGCGKSRLVQNAERLLPGLQGAAERFALSARSYLGLPLSAQCPSIRVGPGARPELMLPGGLRRESLEEHAWRLAAGGTLVVDELDRAHPRIAALLMDRLELRDTDAMEATDSLPIVLATTNRNPRQDHKGIPCGLLDRMDLVVSVPAVAVEAALTIRCSQTGEACISLISAARERQRHRQGCLNAHLSRASLAAVTPRGGESSQLLRQVAHERSLGVRAIDSVRRVALSIADVQGESPGDPQHLLEALTWRWSAPGPITGTVGGYSGNPGAKPRRMAFSQQARGSTNCSR